MIEQTLLIFGPGGIGKSPVDALVRADALRIDPYRLRGAGPRECSTLILRRGSERDRSHRHDRFEIVVIDAGPATAAATQTANRFGSACAAARVATTSSEVYAEWPSF